MHSFLLRVKQTVPHSLDAPNTHIYLGALSFFGLSLLIGYFLSSSTTYAALLLGALFGIVVSLRPIIGLYLMVVSIPFEEISTLVPSLTAIKLIGWVVLGGWMLNIALTKKAILFPREAWYLVAFMAWGLISALWAVDPSIVVKRIPMMIQLLGFYVLIINLISTKDRIYHLYWVLLIGCILAAGLTFFFFREVYLLEEVRGERISVGGANHFAYTFLLIIPFLFLSIIFRKSKLLRFALLGIVGVILWSFFLAMSRGAVLALTVIILAMLVKYRRYAPRLMVFIPVVILAGLYFMPEAFWLRMVSGFSLEDKAAGRLNIWLVGLNMIMINPILGVGLNCFAFAFSSYIEMAGLLGVVEAHRAPHNIYLEAVAELGIVGGLLLFMLVFKHLKIGYKAVKDFEAAKDRSGEIMAMSVLLSFLGLLVAGIAANILYRKYFWISMALVETVSLVSSNASDVQEKFPKSG